MDKQKKVASESIVLLDQQGEKKHEDSPKINNGVNKSGIMPNFYLPETVIRIPR